MKIEIIWDGVDFKNELVLLPPCFFNSVIYNLHQIHFSTVLWHPQRLGPEFLNIICLHQILLRVCDDRTSGSVAICSWVILTRKSGVSLSSGGTDNTIFRKRFLPRIFRWFYLLPRDKIVDTLRHNLGRHLEDCNGLVKKSWYAKTGYFSVEILLLFHCEFNAQSGVWRVFPRVLCTQNFTARFYVPKHTMILGR